MIKVLQLAISLIIVLLTTSCSNQTNEILRLEYGGGFSRDQTTYTLKHNKRVTKIKKLSDGTTIEIGKLAKKEYREVKYLANLLANNFSERSIDIHNNNFRTLIYNNADKSWEKTWSPGLNSEYSGDLIFSKILTILTRKEIHTSSTDSLPKKIEYEIH